MKNKKTITTVPELSELEEELKRVKYQNRYKRVLTSTAGRVRTRSDSHFADAGASDKRSKYEPGIV